MGTQTNDDNTIRQIRRIQRREEMKRRKRRQALFRKFFAAGILLLALAAAASVFMIRMKKDTAPEKKDDAVTDQKPPADMVSVSQAGTEPGRSVSEDTADEKEEKETDTNPVSYQYASSEDTIQPGDEVGSAYAVFIDLDTKTILADKRAKDRMVPASMTKVLTLLVAAENISSLDDTFTITREITDYCYVNDCSAAGFEKDETVTVRDLMYGTILPSGAEAALGLAFCTAGSQEAFVEMMNQKLAQLGLSETTHFTNCIGIFDENHYSSACDIAVIMNAAIENEICREVLSAHTYTTSVTEQHPEGILLSNWFLRRIEDKDTGGEVICGKTGYVEQSGSCAVSYGTDHTGAGFICVSANGNSKWSCINDHAGLYKRFSGSEE